MAGPLDAIARSLTHSLTGKHGKPITYTRTVTGAYDPATGQPATTTSAEMISVLMGDTSKLQRLGFAETGSIESGDLAVDVPAASLEAAFGAGVTPSNTDTLTVDGAVYGVAQLKPQWANAQVHTWALQIRR